ncbi:MAG TPA: MmgE/PrpD family protein [Jatrophihabitans sp.]|nr:MmgE/PrpD family protein [Jatrophihabitans sp.]
MTVTAQVREGVTITEQLADYVLGLRYEDLPEQVVAKTKALLAHHLGIALRDQTSREARLGTQFAALMGGTTGQHTVIGRRERADLMDAVFANSLLMLQGARHDCVLPPNVNPGVAVQPAAWAVGEDVGASGRKFLTAVVVGYDVMTRLHAPTWTWDLDVPRPAKWSVSPFGVAATVARLYGLSRERTVHALGHAGQAGIGIYEGAAQHWMMHALAARGGVLAASLARAGFPASRTPVEGTHGLFESVFLQAVPDAVMDNLITLGDDFAIMRAETRKYPAGVLNGPPVKLLLQLLLANGIRSEDVARVDLVLPCAREAREAVYDTAEQRGPSWLLAAVLADGCLDERRFDEPPDERRCAMRERVRLRFEADRPLRYARVEVTTTDGRQFEAEGDRVEVPPSDLRESLSAGTAAGLPIDRLVDLMQHLEDVPNVADVLACLRPEPTR